jgi:hypothetical protein
MLKLLLQVAQAGVLSLGTALLIVQSTQVVKANSSNSPLDELDIYNQDLEEGNSEEGNSLEQLTSVSQLRDVAPTDWAYEALRNLVERYGCIVGYPDLTYRGNRTLSRYEFAAGLNACMQQMERLLANSEAVLREDLETLKRLSKEFEAELAALGTRVDNLEGRVAFLEDHQFSTTTKLAGEVVFGLYGVAAGEKDGGQQIDQVPAFGDRTRLEFNTSFNGKDLLFARLSAGNISDLVNQTDTFQSTLSFVRPGNNDVELEVLYYNFPVNDKVQLWVGATGEAADDFTNTLNFLDGDGSTGAISAFGTRNPIYYPMEGAGAGMQAQLGKFQLSAGYLAADAANPQAGAGLFNGSYGALAQVGYVPNDNFGIALTYIHGYNQIDTGTGTTLSNFRFFTEDNFGQAVPVSSNSYGLEFSWHLWDKFVLGGWGGYTTANTLSTLGGQIDRGGLDIWNWAVTLAFPDFLKQGSTAGIIVGMQPWVSNSTVDLGSLTNENKDTSMHIEAFYQYPVTDNIQITPGIIVVTSPNGDSNNPPLVIGTIRTTFSGSHAL